ncbi:MAG: hypothetical protein ACJ78Y_17995, partial [Myxococcales bacterium]
MPSPIAPMITGALALAGDPLARKASRRPPRLVPATSRRGPACELSADLVASLHAFVLRLVPDPCDAADIAQQALLLACSDHRGSRIANVE